MLIDRKGKIGEYECLIRFWEKKKNGISKWGGSALIKSYNRSHGPTELFPGIVETMCNDGIKTGECCIVSSMYGIGEDNPICVIFEGTGELKTMNEKQETNYAGCHQEIADSLKRGQHVAVLCNGVSHKKDMVYAYVAHHSLPYKGILANYDNDTCKPLPKTEERVVGIVEMANGLVDHGYTQRNKGTWECKDDIGCFGYNLFNLCGEKYAEDGSIFLPDWMIETVEVD